MTSTALARGVLLAAVAAVALFFVGRALRPPARVVVDVLRTSSVDSPDTGLGPAHPMASADPVPVPSPIPPEDDVEPTSRAASGDGRAGARGAVSGVVVDHQGRPVHNAIVRRPGVQGGRNARTTTDAAGRFILVGLREGRIALEVHVPDVVALERGPGLGAASFEAEVGTSDHRVVVDLGAEVALRWGDPTPAPASVTVWVRREGGPPVRTVQLDTSGRGVLRGLRATDRLIAWVPPDADDRAALVRDAPPKGEVVLRREATGRIVGTLSGLASVHTTTVSAEESDCFVRVIGTLRADGGYELRGLPTGTRWRVTATVDAGGDGVEGRSVSVDDARPGATVDLDLAAAR